MEKTNILSPFQRLIRLLKVYRKQIGYIYIYAMFSGLIYLTIPLGIQTVINFLLGGQVSASLVILILFVIAATAFSGWFQIMQLWLIEYLEQSIFTKASLEFAFRIPRLQLDAIHNEYLPELVNRFFDILSIQKGLSKLLIDFSMASLQVVFGLLILSFYHPLFIALGSTIVFVVYLIFRYSGPRGLETSLKESKAKYEVVHWLEEVARTLNTFKLAGGSSLPMDNTDRLVTEYLTHRKKHFKILMSQFFNMVLFKVVVIGGVLILGSYLVLTEQINIGQFVASEIIIIMVIASIEKLILNIDTVYDVLTALEKVGTVTDFPIEKERGIELSSTGKGLKVSCRKVSFAYPGSDKNTLDGLDLDISSGEKLCVAGFNGAGKTTLLKLMAGLYEGYRGNILFNDVPLQNIKTSSLRALIGDCLFEESLFEGTLYENITLGRPGISLEQVKQAVEAVHLSGFLESNKDGYFVTVNPEGKRLPDSVIVKIILARSIVATPSLVLLTDSLMVLESEERKNIIDYFTNSGHTWTLVLVSNNLETVKKCDRVILLHNGKIIENEPVRTMDINKTSYQKTLI